MNIIRLFPSEQTPFASSVADSAIGLGIRDIAALEEGFTGKPPRLRVLPAPARAYVRRKKGYVRYQQRQRWEAIAFLLLAGSGLAGIVLSLVTAFHH